MPRLPNTSSFSPTVMINLMLLLLLNLQILSTDARPGRRQSSGGTQNGQCELGAWSCVGNTLSRCDVNYKVIVVKVCDAGTVCSALKDGFVGCQWATTGVASPTPDITAVTPPATVNPPPVVVHNVSPPPEKTAGASVGTAVGTTMVATTAVTPIGTSIASANPVGTAKSTPLDQPAANGPAPTTVYTAPHYVMYADLSFMPDKLIFPTAQQLTGINRFILGYWVPSLGGVFDNAKVWAEKLTAAERAEVLKSYHDAGIALMIAYGGQTEVPTTNGESAKQIATDVAAYVKKYGLDGVDVNYEDLQAMDGLTKGKNGQTAEDWVIEFHQTLRGLLPKPYLISHAPIAPWFNPAGYKNGGYMKVHEAIKGDIDWYNIQYYNQELGNYVDCASIFDKAPNQFPMTSVFEIIKNGIPGNKLVVGKPKSTEKATRGGYMDFTALGLCVKQANAKGWNGGLMMWEWDPTNIPSNSQAFAAAKGGP